MTYIIPMPPTTKKNHQQIFRNRATGKPFVMPSAQYKSYEAAAGCFLTPRPNRPIDTAVEVRCLFYMPTKRRLDLTNLLEAIDDILVRCGVLEDDHSGIIVSHDGSRVLLDRDNPRTEINITEITDKA